MGLAVLGARVLLCLLSLLGAATPSVTAGMMHLAVAMLWKTDNSTHG